MTRTYLDWNATAPLRPEARAAMIDATEITGNPSSVHAEGRAAKLALERAREDIASALLFLSSPLSSYVNGQTLVVDGGVGVKFPYPMDF